MENHKETEIVNVSSQHTSSDMEFLSHSYSSKEDFISKYKEIYFEKGKSGELYLLVLSELQDTISSGNIKSLKRLSNLIEYFSDIEDQATLKNYYDNDKNPIKNTNLLILACKHNKVSVLNYLLGVGYKILNTLLYENGQTVILPEDEDDTHHNVFYYAVRSGNLELLETLINKWPGNYFAINSGKLDTVLSQAYEELKLINVSLSEKIKLFVETKLINLRFYSKASGQNCDVKNDPVNIRERIQLVLERINLLRVEYSTTEEVDAKFLFIVNFIAQNMHILKQQLKSTYDRLPWEEIEFCLICFVTSHSKNQEINLIYHATLNKHKILKYMVNFATNLENIYNGNIDEFSDLSKLNRDKVLVQMINKYPQFEELYNDHQQIRDIHSLEKISDYVKLASSVDLKQREDQLIIMRCLYMIGVYFKNTLEHPNLSSNTSELLLLSLPRHTKEIIIDLCNSPSHGCSLSKRIEIEQNNDINFFIAVQNDLKQTGDVITTFIYDSKIKNVRILLKRILNSDSVDEIKEIFEVIGNAKFDQPLAEYFVTKYKKLETVILSYSAYIKSSLEQILFDKIQKIMSVAGNKKKLSVSDFITGFESLQSLSSALKTYTTIDHSVFTDIKCRAKYILECISPKYESHSLKEICELSMELFKCLNSRICCNNLDIVTKLTCEIFCMAELEIGDIKWITELRDNLNEKGSFIPETKPLDAIKLHEEGYNNHLALKLSQLNEVLRNNELSGKLFENISSLKANKKLQAVLEMLILDVLSILDYSKDKLENNLLYLDDNTPLLTGKCLWNHLAHNNPLVDILLSNSSIAVISNAKQLASENIIKTKKKFGKLVRDDPFKVKEKNDKYLNTISNQKKMFIAVEEGNLENLNCCLKKGADINAKNINSWTAIHYAAKGSSLEIAKFVFSQSLDANVNDSNGQSPLHISAAFGRQNTVEFLLREIGLQIDAVDSFGKTPLHSAAQNGHVDVVQFLLKNGADTTLRDVCGLSPIFYAIRNSHVNIAKVLLVNDTNVVNDKAMGGVTPLHEAAESGQLELVSFLLQNKANVNAINEMNWTPLHGASTNGHLEVVNTLITSGAAVNASDSNGCTPLHYAVSNGHRKVAVLLLKRGANVNDVDKTFNNTSLHYAVNDGHLEIVMVLLEYKANAKATNNAGLTPLHVAALSGHREISIVLLNHGVNINAKDKDITTPLHYAVENGHKEVVEVLITHRAEINVKNYVGSTPLHIAALKGHKYITDLLIRNKARINKVDDEGRTPLYAAVKNGNRDVIDLLIKNKADVKSRTYVGATPLHLAALNGHAEATVLLIDNKADINTKGSCGFTPLHAAVTRGHIDVVNILINNGADVNAEGVVEGSTPLHAAVRRGLKDIVELLVVNGASLNVRRENMTPLLSAINHNRKEIVEVLIANGANVTSDNEPLSYAVFTGYKDIVDVLLKSTANINIQNPDYNYTLLHVAAKRGHREVVKALIGRGADVNATNSYNVTPLYLAAQEGHDEIVEILIANGAKVNAVNNIEGAALHIAAGQGHDNVVEVLIKCGANVSLKDNKSRTPLELAVANSHLHVVEVLLQCQTVDINAKGEDDMTILHLASQRGDLDMIKYLVDRGSNIDAKTASDSKPIHIAVIGGHKHIVEFFLNKGLSVDELGSDNQTLLHYAAMEDQHQVAEYLIRHGADVNARDSNGATPMHTAAFSGSDSVIDILLKAGAVYNNLDNSKKTPLDVVTTSSRAETKLAITEQLFHAVKRNSFSEVDMCIKTGAGVNASSLKGTPLLYAAWKGYDRIVNLLLQNKANPNTISSKRSTPLHYAVKCSHLKVVRALLSHGAMYDSVTDDNKTALDFAVDSDIAYLLQLITDSFKKVKNNDKKLSEKLKTVNDVDTLKAVFGARNRDNKSLVVEAVNNKYSKLNALLDVCMDHDLCDFDCNSFNLPLL